VEKCPGVTSARGRMKTTQDEGGIQIKENETPYCERQAPLWEKEL